MYGGKKAQTNISNGCSWEPCGFSHLELSLHPVGCFQHSPLTRAEWIFMSYQTRLNKGNGKATGVSARRWEGGQGMRGVMQRAALSLQGPRRLTLPTHHPPVLTPHHRLKTHRLSAHGPLRSQKETKANVFGPGIFLQKQPLKIHHVVLKPEIWPARDF